MDLADSRSPGGARMAGGHDQLWKDLIRAFPGDFLRLVDGDFAAQLDVSPLAFAPADEVLDRPTGAERRMDLVGLAEFVRGGKLLLHVEVELRFRSAVPVRLWTYNRLLGLRRRLPVHSYVLYLRGGPAGREESRFRELSGGREVGA